VRLLRSHLSPQGLRLLAPVVLHLLPLLQTLHLPGPLPSPGSS